MGQTEFTSRAPERSMASAPPAHAAFEFIVQLRQLGLILAALAVLFAWPLYQLARYALKEDLYSHVLLIPFIAAYLIRMRWRESGGPTRLERDSPQTAVLALAVGLGAVAYYWLVARGGGWKHNDALSLLTFAWVILCLGAVVWCMGKTFAREHMFALTFLLLMIPLPSPLMHALTVFFQYASAEVSYWVLKLIGTPVFRQGLVFQMPSLTIEVAEECSGIRSSLVLFITSLLAGYMFLRQAKHRWVMALAVIPIGIFRNALRIVGISWLTIQVDPGIIHGPLHTQGGPLFFIASLVPFFLLLYGLRRREVRRSAP